MCPMCVSFSRSGGTETIDESKGEMKMNSVRSNFGSSLHRPKLVSHHSTSESCTFFRMAPKSQPKSVPKAVQAIRGLMGDTEITADSLKNTLSAAAYNNLCNNFRNQLTTEQKADYKKVGVVEARSWIAQFVLVMLHYYLLF